LEKNGLEIFVQNDTRIRDFKKVGEWKNVTQNLLSWKHNDKGVENVARIPKGQGI
jgi:hypothetical protein